MKKQRRFLLPALLLLFLLPLSAWGAENIGEAGEAPGVRVNYDVDYGMNWEREDVKYDWERLEVYWVGERNPWDLPTNLSMSLSSGWHVRELYCLKDAATYERLPQGAECSLEDPRIADIQLIPFGENDVLLAYHLKAWGVTALHIQVNDLEYTVPFRVELPEVGLYTAPVASTDNYLSTDKIIVYDGTPLTYYLLPYQTEKTIEEIWFEGDQGGEFDRWNGEDISASEYRDQENDLLGYTISIHPSSPQWNSTWLEVVYQVSKGDWSDNWGTRFDFQNLSSGLRWYDGGFDENWDPEEQYSNACYTLDIFGANQQDMWPRMREGDLVYYDAGKKTYSVLSDKDVTNVTSETGPVSLETIHEDDSKLRVTAQDPTVGDTYDFSTVIVYGDYHLPVYVKNTALVSLDAGEAYLPDMRNMTGVSGKKLKLYLNLTPGGSYSGFQGMGLQVEFDPDYFTFEGATGRAASFNAVVGEPEGEITENPPFFICSPEETANQNGCVQMLWTAASQVNVSGTMAVLTFQVKEGLDIEWQDWRRFTLREFEGWVDETDGDGHGYNYISDKDWAELDYVTDDMEVCVRSYAAGDVNSDGSVNNRDVTDFLRYLVGYDMSKTKFTGTRDRLDLYRDDRVNLMDVTWLLKYNAGHPVILEDQWYDNTSEAG